MTGFALTYRLTPDGAERRAEFDNRTAALGFRYGVTHWAAEVSAVVELDRPPFAWFRPGAGAPVLETVPVAEPYVPDEDDLPTTADLIGLVPDITDGVSAAEHVRRLRDDDFEQGGTGAILDGSVAGAAEEDDNR